MTTKRKSATKKPEPTLILKGSNKCLRGMARTMSGKGKPDFTITNVIVSTVWAEEDSTGVVIDWETASGGFGELTISIDPMTAKATLDTEAMGREFAKSVLAKLVDGASLK